MSTSRQAPEFTRLLTPAEVAAMFRVDPKTVTRWAKDGKLTSVRTLGGHRRYPEAEVRAAVRAYARAARVRASPATCGCTGSGSRRARASSC